MKRLSLILLSCLFLQGCNNYEGTKPSEDKSEEVEKEVKKEAIDIKDELDSYIRNMLISYDLKTVEGMRDSLFYFDDIEDIINKKSDLTDREKYFISELKRNKETLENYINTNSDERILNDFEELNLMYISKVLLPFHSIHNNYELIIKDNRDTNEFFDITLLMMNDVFILEQPYTKEDLLIKMDKEYLLDTNPVDLVDNYINDNKKFSKSENDFELVMYTAIQKIYIEWLAAGKDEYSPLFPMFTELKKTFPKDYLDTRETL